MSQINKVELGGVITRVTPNGQFGTVTLDKPFEAPLKSFSTGELNDETLGRKQMIIKHPHKVLVEGAPIKITKFRTGIDSLLILEIKS